MQVITLYDILRNICLICHIGKQSTVYDPLKVFFKPLYPVAQTVFSGRNTGILPETS